MGFPTIDYSAAVAKYHEAVLQNGTTLDVRLRTGETFTIKGTLGKLQPEDLTEGLTQQGYKLKIPAAHWDAATDRPPEKGDQITMWGRRSAIMSWYMRGVGDDFAVYNLLMKG